jgi:hypothetical protein
MPRLSKKKLFTCEICGYPALCKKIKVVNILDNRVTEEQLRAVVKSEKNLVTCCTYCEVGLRAAHEMTWKKLKRFMNKKYENYDSFLELALYLSIPKKEHRKEAMARINKIKEIKWS